MNKKLERDCNTLRRNADERKRADHLEQSNSGRRDAQIQKLQIQFQRKTNELAQAVIHLEMVIFEMFDLLLVDCFFFMFLSNINCFYYAAL